MKKSVVVTLLQAKVEALQQTSLRAEEVREVPKLNIPESSLDNRQKKSHTSIPHHAVSGTSTDPVCNVKPLLAERMLGTVKWLNVENGYVFANRIALTPMKMLSYVEGPPRPTFARNSE